MRNKLVIILSCFIVGFAPSCTSKTPKLKLSRAEKVRVDSLYKLQVPDLDSIIELQCKNDKTNNYQKMKDSIISIRLEEIQDILPK